MMLTSTPIKAEAGAKLGLVDAVVPKDQLLQVRCKHVLALCVEGGLVPSWAWSMRSCPRTSCCMCVTGWDGTCMYHVFRCWGGWPVPS